MWSEAILNGDHRVSNPNFSDRSFLLSIRFFDLALRRLKEPYNSARLIVCVGDKCELTDVRDQNPWSKNRDIEWIRVPDRIFDRHGLHGTADWRYMHETEADVVFLCDADTALVRDIDPILAFLAQDHPIVAGHMAHLPPPYASKTGSASSPHEFWRYLFSSLAINFPDELHPYSMDVNAASPAISCLLQSWLYRGQWTRLRNFSRGDFNVQEQILGLMTPSCAAKSR